MIAKISFNSSSNSSASSSTCVKDIINKWGNNTIASCVLGISKIGYSSNISYNIAHAALLLLDKNIDYEEEDELQNEVGILIEYGDYSSSMDKTEKKYVDKGFVIYHYGNKWGLRYYWKKYSEFIKQFGDIGYIDFNIIADNQISFELFLNHIAKLKANKWIKERYSASMFSNFNCQTFVAEALKVLKPYFSFENISPRAKDLMYSKSFTHKINFVPQDIKQILSDYYKKKWSDIQLF